MFRRLSDLFNLQSRKESLPLLRFNYSKRQEAVPHVFLGCGVVCLLFVVTMVGYTMGRHGVGQPTPEQLQEFLKDWHESGPHTAGPLARHTVPTPVYKLWGQMQTDTELAVRKHLILHELTRIKPRRLFEFGAVTGGVLAQSAFLNPQLNASLHHWVHVSSSPISLEYAAMLFGDDVLMANPSIDLDQFRERLPKGWTLKSPFSRISPVEAPTKALEVVDADIGDVHSWIHSFTLSHFDTLVAPAFDSFSNPLGLMLALPRGKRFVFCISDSKNPGGPFSSEASIREYVSLLMRVDHVSQVQRGGYSTFLVRGVLTT